MVLIQKNIYLISFTHQNTKGKSKYDSINQFHTSNDKGKYTYQNIYTKIVGNSPCSKDVAVVAIIYPMMRKKILHQ